MFFLFFGLSLFSTSPILNNSPTQPLCCSMFQLLPLSLCFLICNRKRTIRTWLGALGPLLAAGAPTRLLCSAVFAKMCCFGQRICCWDDRLNSFELTKIKQCHVIIKHGKASRKQTDCRKLELSTHVCQPMESLRPSIRMEGFSLSPPLSLFPSPSYFLSSQNGCSS